MAYWASRLRDETGASEGRAAASGAALGDDRPLMESYPHAECEGKAQRQGNARAAAGEGEVQRAFEPPVSSLWQHACQRMRDIGAPHTRRKGLAGFGVRQRVRRHIRRYGGRRMDAEWRLRARLITRMPSPPRKYRHAGWRQPSSPALAQLLNGRQEPPESPSPATAGEGLGEGSRRWLESLAALGVKEVDARRIACDGHFLAMAQDGVGADPRGQSLHLGMLRGMNPLGLHVDELLVAEMLHHIHVPSSVLGSFSEAMWKSSGRMPRMTLRSPLDAAFEAAAALCPARVSVRLPIVGGGALAGAFDRAVKEVHRGAADEAGDEEVGGVVVEFLRRAQAAG